jgi:hypothetical protein
MIPAHVRRAAQTWGLTSAQLRDLYVEFRQLARQEREWLWNLRKRVWERYAYSPASRPFWRHGLQRRFADAFTDGDHAAIPGWDDVAQSMACEFPELLHTENVAQRLYDLLKAPHDRLPSVEATWQAVLDYCESHRDQLVPEAAPF